jgi:hypothetical protein
MQGTYKVKGRQGAHLARALRDLDGVVTVEVLLIGSTESHQIGYDIVSHWERVLSADVQPYTPAAAYQPTGPADLVTLAQEAVTIYALDPARVQRAAQIAHRRYTIINAYKDEHGITIPRPSLNVLAVESDTRRGWYVVRPGSCTCKDNENGHTCKHRIAAWMHRESIIRPLATARRVSKTQILAELTA